MAEYELIEERLISGKGVLQVPVDKVKNRTCTLYLSVVREPKSKYYNANYNPPRGKYAWLTYVRNGYVIGYADMEFERQSYDTIADISGQVLIALKCTHQAVIAAIADLGTALNVQVSIAPNIIKDYENLNLMWDEVRIVCYADTAIQARLYRLQYDNCLPDYDNQRKPPPPPPPPPKIPPGTPIGDISVPYDGANDGGSSVPYDGDNTPPPPPPPIPECTNVIITINGTWDLSANGSFSLTVGGKAPVDDVYADPPVSGGTSIYVIDRQGSGGSCSPTPVTRQVDRRLGTVTITGFTVTEAP